MQSLLFSLLGNVKTNMVATNAPAITDDASAGYTITSVWFDTQSQLLYELVDSTAGAAVWKQISSSGMSGINTFMFSGTNSDIGGYESMQALSAYVVGALATKATTITASETLMEEFATDLGFPGITSIPAGLFTCHYQTQKTSNSIAYYTYFKLYKRASGGTETLLGTSDNTSEVTANTIVNQTTDLILTTNTTLLATDRLVVKIYGVMLSGSVNIDLLFDDATNARFEAPSSTIDVTNFVPYTGATQNVTLGTKQLTATGLVDSSLTASELLASDGSKKLQSLAVASYPSIAEIAYVKGVTSAIQTQLNAKAALDANSNFSANNFLGGYATTATAAGTTTLTVASARTQDFTGTTTHTVQFPVVNTLALNFPFIIRNRSTREITLTSSGGNTILVLAPNTQATVTCISLSGTDAASWLYEYSFFNGTNAGNAIFPTTALGGPLLFPDGLYRYEQTLSSAEIKGMYDTPVLVLSAPPANLYHQMSPFSYAFLTFGTAAYTLGGTHFLQNGNGVHGSGLQVLTSWTAASNALWSTTSLARRGMLSATNSAAPTSLSAAIYASNSGAAFATGDSTLTYRLAYSLLSAV